MSVFARLCVEVVTNYGINQFKFDGIGENTGTGGGGAQRDFDAMLKLIGELRALKPDIYINQTTGTWPSPFWLLYADSIWRGGEDHSFVTAPRRNASAGFPTRTTTCMTRSSAGAICIR